MKKLILAAAAAMLSTSAMAADAIWNEPTPVAPMAPMAYDWTGVYIGGFGGVATGDFNYDLNTPAGTAGTLGTTAGGGFGGAQIGYDFQTGAWVFGAIADIAATNIDNDVSASITGLGTVSAKSEIEYLGTVRGRVGYAFDRTLVYAHGGWAYGETEITLTDGVDTISGSTRRNSGYTVGAGAEFAVTDQISIGAEYGYFDLGNRDVAAGTAFGTPFVIREDVDFHSVKGFVNFRF